jgi:hypothetical protein
VSAPAGGTSGEESWPGANEAKTEKLLVRSLKRRAGVYGLEIRHSDYGYALIESGHKHLTDRNDMTLAEIELALDRAPSP